MMKYTYTITEDLICLIKKDDVVIDNPGPWESRESADYWAKIYVEELNSGVFEEGLNASD
jgi:hypothetical protein